jgi:hypothetical protein
MRQSSGPATNRSASPVRRRWSTSTARVTLTLGHEVLRSIPRAQLQRAAAIRPGVVTSSTTSSPDSDDVASDLRRSNLGRPPAADGLTVGSAPNGNSATSYVIDVGTRKKSFVSGGVGEVETAGLVTNAVPKSGNEMRGSAFAGGTAHHFNRAT